MRILIVGAGAVGGFFGAYLLQAQRDVTFLVRPKRAQQLAENGLRLQSASGNLAFPKPKTVTADKLTERFDLILLSCKAWDLESAMNDFAPAVGEATCIIPLLNGMAHLDTLDARFGRERVLGGATSISTTVDGEGRILHLNPLNMLQFGSRDEPDAPRMIAIEEFLTVPGIQLQRSSHILQDMWQKWVTITTAVGTTCLMRATSGDVVAADATFIIDQCMAEAAAIATAEGYPPAKPYLEILRGKFTERGSLFTASMLRDIEAGNPIEADQIVGDLLAHGKAKSIATPLLEVLYAHLRCYQARRDRERA